MKYIKKFNENVSNELEGLSEFLDDYFVEFSDMGFVIDSEYQIGFADNVWLDINKKDGEDFHWNDIKDYFITFLEMLDSKFRIYHIKFGLSGYYNAVSKESIIDDKLPNFKLHKIIVHVKF